jgi:hypothetical protein
MADAQQHNVASIMEIMKEIEVIYSDSAGDCKDVTDTYQIRNEISEICNQKEANAKLLIRGEWRVHIGMCQRMIFILFGRAFIEH